jgi:signal transduction histidine kinase/ligand-binding sensor domain-containing protein/DNA-binding response OmpR family regulator
MLKHIWLHLAVGFLCCNIVVAQPAHSEADVAYRNITMDDKLPSNTVRHVVQDGCGFIWMGTDNGLCRYDGIQVLTYRIPQLGSNQYVSALMADGQRVYVGTEQGVFSLNVADDHFEHLPIDIHTAVSHLTLDCDSQLWVSTLGQGVWRYHPKTGSRHHYDIGQIAQVYVDNSNQVWTVSNWSTTPVCRLNRLHDRFDPIVMSGVENCHALCMLQTKDGQLWIGSWENGLLRMHSDGRIEQVTMSDGKHGAHHIHTLTERDDGSILIGCDDGVISYNPKTGDWHQPLTPYSSPLTFAYSILNDHEGGLWIGTFYAGVCYLSPVGKRFEGITVSDGLAGSIISRFCEDHDGNIWIASDDGGLMCFNPSLRSALPLRSSKNGQWSMVNGQFSNLNVHALALKNDELWIGTYSDGLYVLNLVSGQLRHYIRTNDEHSLDDSSVYAILHDSHGRTWAATMHGLNFFNDTTDTFERIGNLGALTIDIVEDHTGALWLATQGGGLWQYQPDSRQLRQFIHQADDKASLPSDQVNAILIDESQRLWIGTSLGLCYLSDVAKGRFQQVRLNVPSQNIMGIVEDHGVLWLPTDRGIVRYEPLPAGSTLQRFTRHDGLVSLQAQPSAVLKASDGRIFVGTTGGFNMFYPYQIKANNVMPKVYVTQLNYFNQQDDTQHYTLLPETVVLNHDEARILTLSFAALSYYSPTENQYEYMMDGFDRNWNRTSGINPKATYTNLPAGTYTFRVRATNSDGVWSKDEVTLTIVVNPPLWWTWWAKMLYVIFIALAIWYYVHIRLKRAERKHQQELQRVNEQKEKESREARLSFFTMVAHEIRTPVSLIIGPLEKLKNTINDKQLDIIDRNAHRLLELVNQLLDFRKVEQHSLVMHFASHNVNELLHSISERFEPTFEQGGKQFTTVYPPERFTAIIDREGITKVISNLLTNANKYAKSHVELRCMANSDDDRFVIEVTDDGVGIRQEDIERIFEPFFQSQGNKPGTGIGLNIVKRIVDLHHGTIGVQSVVGQGSTFTITLPAVQPLGTQELSAQETNKPDIVEQQQPSITSQVSARPEGTLPPGKTVLIVDDNDDMVSFLASHFARHYTVLTATDGIEALNLIAKHEVSIIVSDWMMPRMDGADLCRQIRRNPLTSHIPFLMLTAKTDNKSKTEGMNVGADIYIEKPFSVEYLEACIANILQMRRLLMQKVSTQPFEDVAQMGTNPVDNEFLKKMNQIIEDNVANADLNVNFLAEQLNISRSGLFAKIKSLTDVTPNEMIQVVRLKRAARLLLENNYLVSEVGYMVGFSSPSYFTKCFQKQFGMKPGDYVKKGR